MADKDNEKSRVQLDLTPTALARLKFLMEKTEAASYAEVVRNALKLYDGLVEMSEQGAQFIRKDPDGQVTIYPFWTK